MNQQKYSVIWHNYSDHLKIMMKELMMNEHFADVTLVTEDKKQIKANIDILSACSPVFKNTLITKNKSSHIMYLRGIQFSEMESIMQFIYLGEAIFCEERMDEFLAVAKSLEINVLCNAEIRTKAESKIELSPNGSVTSSETLEEETVEIRRKAESKNEPSPDDPVKSSETLEEETVKSDHLKMQVFKERRREVVNGKFKCHQCDKSYAHGSHLTSHIQSKHEGIKYPCDQCNYQATTQGSLRIHTKSKHEGVKYDCDQCDYQSTQPSNLYTHKLSVHKGVRYSCDQCGFHATRQSGIARHIQEVHEGVNYTCDKCDYKTTRLSYLSRHKLRKH